MTSRPAARPQTATHVAAAGGKNVATTGESLPAERPANADVERAVRRLEQFARDAQRDLQFQIDDATGITVITVRDAATKEVVRQIPAEEVLAVSRLFAESGTLFDVSI
jgi:flagellar protein FlaG